MSDYDLVGMVLDEKYRLERKIGEGGMGAVYRGVQMMVDRPVAVKVLHASLASHEKLMQRFEVEAKAIGRMNHPNCVTLYDFGFSKQLGAFYMVMEYLEGTPMQDLLGRGLGAQAIVDIARQIALALDHAHHHHILHRDLKPENVMVTTMTDGTMLVKVLDFGIARIFHAEEEAPEDTTGRNRLTQAGEIFGTPAYISPEQARGEQDLSFSSDLYSLGIMLYELIQGDLPFWGETPIDTIMQHINKPVPPLDRLDIPQGLKQITIDLMAKRPERRPQTGKEVADRLSEIPSHTPSLPRPPHAPYHRDAPLVPSLEDIAAGGSRASDWATLVKTQVDLPPAAQSHSGIYAKEAIKDFGAQRAFDTEVDFGRGTRPWKAIVFGVLSVVVLSLGAFALFALDQEREEVEGKEVAEEAVTQKAREKPSPDVHPPPTPQETPPEEPKDSALLGTPPESSRPLNAGHALEPQAPSKPIQQEKQAPATKVPLENSSPEPQERKKPAKKPATKKPVRKPEKQTFESISL